MIFKNNKELKQKDFKNEKELQNYFEANLERFLGLKFIDTEFWINNHKFRIDTLAYDEESCSFRIIEYKNIKNHSLVDQGYTYLKQLLENKADFVLQYNLKTGKSLSIPDIDWTQSRIIFVSPIFSNYQLNATDFKNIPVDLVKVTKYEDEIIEIDKIQKTSNVTVEELETIDSELNKVSREVKVYTEEDHLNNRPDKIKNLYEMLRERIMELDDIDLEVKKNYVAFKGRTNIVDVEFSNSKMRLDINMKKGTLDDPKNLCEDLTLHGHWGNGDYRYFVSEEENIDTAIGFIKQSLKVNKK